MWQIESLPASFSVHIAIVFVLPFGGLLASEKAQQ